MNSRERLMATLGGKPVDRPAVNFYEVGGFLVDPTDQNPFNIYNSPSWQSLLRLAEQETDLIRMLEPKARPAPHNPHEEFFSSETFSRNGSRITHTTLRASGRVMTQTMQRNRDIDTIWTTEYLLKDEADLRAFVELPDEVFDETCSIDHMAAVEKDLGDRGIVMIDRYDPIAVAKSLMSLDFFTIIAYTEGNLFHRLLQKLARPIYESTEKLATAFPGRLWRIPGPEIAAEPFLPPSLFHDYVVRYTGPLVKIIQEHGGYVRLHCHGRLRGILKMIASMGVDGLDPVEPPEQGDMHLAEVRKAVGEQMVLFGNLEARDLENLPPEQFKPLVARALREGTQGEGRGFVLMPSASPYGRTITPQTMTNYETMIRLAREFTQ